MAQCDVYLNPDLRQRDKIPYVVDLQSNLLNPLPTRFVAPLVRPSVAMSDLPGRFIPDFVVQGTSLTLRPHLSGAIDARRLKRPVQSLRPHAHEITSALDTLISGV